jgi:predicted O-methyltransferase YrrM
MMNKVATLFQSTLMRRGASQRSPAVEPELPVHDVTHLGAEINLAALDVIRWAPVWMTRAERLLLYTLIFALRPARYLEIGTFKGGSALVVTAAMDSQDADGRLICIDPEPQIDPEHWKRLEHRTTLLRGFSPDILSQAYKVAGGPFDFVLIDGDHTYAGVLRDANGVLPFVADGAYLLFHDSFFGEIAQALGDFAAQHPHEIVDFGTLTREVTLQSGPEGESIRWGGLRLMQVRRNIVAR